MKELKSVSRVVLALILVIVMATSLWFAGPTRALEITISPPASGTTGSLHSFTVTITIEDQELVPIQDVTLYIYKADARATYQATLTNLPLNASSKSYTAAETGGGAANVTATPGNGWVYTTGTGYAYWAPSGAYSWGYGYGYGYGYGAGAVSITYNVTWVSPPGWPAGSYRIDATLTANGDTFTRSSSSFTLSTAVQAPAPSPTPGIKDLTGLVTADGVFISNTTAESADGMVKLTINKGTIGKTSDGSPLTEISIIEAVELPALPKGASTVGLTYDLGPNGATFDPPITITFTYDEADIPSGINEEDLFIAFWDESAGEWVMLKDITVDPVANTINASVSHFTRFSVMAISRLAVFERRLSGDKVGQHKVPPNSYVTMQISVSTEIGLTEVKLIDYLPASWVVSDARGGVVSPVDATTNKIEWAVGDISAGEAVTREYVMLSPERTIPPTKYQFWSEISHSGGSATSEPWDVVVADPAGPKAPSDPYSMGISSTSIAVAWVPSPTTDIDGYKIYRSTNGVDYSLLVTLSGGQLVSSYVDTGLPASTLYYYKISAWRGTQETSQTSATSASTMAPSPPRGLRATGGNGSITLTWEANTESNISGYNVYRATSSNGTFSQINSSLVTTTNYTDDDPSLVGSAFYYYRVTAVDSTSAEGEMSGEAWARPYYNPSSGGPHIAYPATTDACAACHRTHAGQSPKLLPSSAEKDLCFTCHDGSGSQYNIAQEFASPTSQHPVPDETLKCSSCHNAHRNWQTYPKLISADGQSSGNAVCYTCHGATDSNPPTVDYETPFESGFHKSYISNSPTGTQIQCTSCHKPHASTFRSLEIRKDENSCFSCHDGSTVGGDVFSNFIVSSDAKAHHDIFDADQAAQGTKIECVNCHNPHTVKATGSVKKVVNPENPSPASSSRWSDTIPAFCTTCHDDAFPTSAQTEPFAPAPLGPGLINVKEAFYWGTDSKADQMGDATSGASLDPAMGYTVGEPALPCETCHDPHGSVNPFHLRTKVYSKDRSTFKEGLIVIKIAGGGYDFRYFCNACHDESNMGNGKNLPTNCTGGNCHFHGGAF